MIEYKRHPELDIVCSSNGEIYAKSHTKHNSSSANKYRAITFKNKQYRVSRIVAQTFLPNPDNKPCVCHRDDDPSNNHVSNLWWGSHQENSLDMAEKKRNYTGRMNQELIERNIKILELKKDKKFTSREIGELLGMTTNAVNAVIHRLKKTNRSIESLRQLVPNTRANSGILDISHIEEKTEPEKTIKISMNIEQSTINWLDSLNIENRSEIIRKAVSLYRSIYEEIKNSAEKF